MVPNNEHRTAVERYSEVGGETILRERQDGENCLQFKRVAGDNRSLWVTLVEVQSASA